MKWMKKAGRIRAGQKRVQDERGFTLIETAIAMLIMMIVMLGVASVFAFSVSNNSNGADRAQTLAVAQQRLETLRNVQYMPTVTHADLTAGPHTLTVYRGDVGAAGRRYQIDWNVVDNATNNLKTITVKVTPITAGPAWASVSSWSSVTIVTQRAKSD